METIFKKCLYCDNMTHDPHFVSDCCGRGMCGECYGNLQGTEEQYQLDFMEDEDFETIKPEYQKATYLCFNCADIWKVK